jgi:hypothetical protein
VSRGEPPSMTDATALALPASSGPLDRLHRAVAIDRAGLERLRRMAVVGLVALNVLDLVLTRRLLALGGTEANPMMALFINGGWGVAIKLSLPVALGVRHLRAPLERRIVLGLCWMCVLYMGVVLWNSHLLANPQLLG